MDTLDEFLQTRPPTAARPLLGLTVLLVEDSRYASEAVRLLCLRSGARIRRADTLFSARRHLRVYNPTVVIVDLGLPDGSGDVLIDELHRSTPRVEVILGTSGDPVAEALAMDAGANGFIAKPVTQLAEFQSALLQHLPADRQPLGPRIIGQEQVDPDPIALRDDLEHVANTLSGETGYTTIDYVAQFLGGVARSTGDAALSRAVEDVSQCRKEGGPIHAEVAQLAALVQTRLAASSPI